MPNKKTRPVQRYRPISAPDFTMIRIPWNVTFLGFAAGIDGAIIMLALLGYLTGWF